LSFIIIFSTLSCPMHNLQSRPTKPRQGQVTTMETSNHFRGGSNEAAEGGQLPRAQRARGRKTAYFWLTNTKASIMCPNGGRTWWFLPRAPSYDANESAPTKRSGAVAENFRPKRASKRAFSSRPRNTKPQQSRRGTHYITGLAKKWGHTLTAIILSNRNRFRPTSFSLDDALVNLQ